MNNYKISLKDAKFISNESGKIFILISPKTIEEAKMLMGISTVPIKGTVKKHVHDYSQECFFVLQGNGTIFMEGKKSIDFEPDDAVIVPKGVIHSIKNTGDCELKVLFSTSPLAPSDKEGHRNLD